MKAKHLAILILLGPAGLANAVTVYTPSSAVATSSLAATFNATELINGDGLSGVGDILTQTHITVTDNNPVGYWLANEVETPAQEITFTLPSPVDLGTAYIWQYTRTHATWNLRGIDTFDMSFSTDGGSNYGTPIPVSLNVGAMGSPSDETAQTIVFAEQTGVTHVKFSNMANFPGGDGFVALAEVRFGDVIPEPSAALLSILGLGGLLVRRRLK